MLNGEGSVYRTNLSAIRELFIAWLCKCHLGIPTIFVNATVHLTDVMPILPAMVRKTLPARTLWRCVNRSHFGTLATTHRTSRFS